MAQIAKRAGAARTGIPATLAAIKKAAEAGCPDREAAVMGVAIDRNPGPPPDEDALAQRMREEGLSPHGWGNAPGDTYGWHQHDYEKVLYCVRGHIVFHTDDGDAGLGPGDRMVLPPGTRHAATVGSEGVRCIEAPR